MTATATKQIRVEMTTNNINKEDATAAAQSPEVQVPEALSGTHVNMVSLPPAMAAMHGKSSAEILATLNKTPLFMTEVEDNDELEAFKALAYEGTPAEISLNFKERGNECFQAGKWADAKEFYSRGIQVLQASQRERATKSEKSEDTEKTKEQNEDEQKAELQLLEVSLLNRAAAHLALQNYRSTTLDCASVLRLNPHNLKAHHRSAKALFALNHLAEASAILALAQEVRARETQMATKREMEARKDRETRRERERFVQALKRGGVRMRRTGMPLEMGDVRVSLAPADAKAENENDNDKEETRELLFPVLLLYPLPLQSDIITAFPGSSTLRQHLEEVLSPPPPWDTAGEYTIKGVECFMETISGGLIKVGRNILLLKILGSGNVEVVDEVVRIYVLPKSKSAAWVAECKELKAVGKR